MTAPSTAACASSCTCSEVLPEAELREALNEIVAQYKDKPGGLIPALQTAQALYGYLPEDAIRTLSTGFGKTLSEVTGVISFYSFFTLNPRGKHLVRVCLGTACYVRGGKAVLEAFKKKLGVDVGETTPDRQFSLEVGRCFGACGMAPVVMVDETVHQRVKPSRVGDLINQTQASDMVAEEKEDA